MIYVFVSALCSVTVSVILKLSRRYAVDTPQLIVWNYPVAALLTWHLLEPSLGEVQLFRVPWLLYLALALLLPSIFLAIAASIRYTGIVRTEVAQRLSLSIALLAAFWLFDEVLGAGKLVGIGLGFTAMLCCIGWHKENNRQDMNMSMWFYPLIVFLGMGVIDILFKQVALHREVSYTTSMLLVFSLAMVLSIGYLAYRVTVGGKRFSVQAIYWGVILGLFNFGNILFYMKAHRALPDNPSIVFSAMNIGVISLGAVVGLVFFNEKLSKLNKIGLVLAIFAVLVIAYL